MPHPDRQRETIAARTIETKPTRNGRDQPRLRQLVRYFEAVRTGIVGDTRAASKSSLRFVVAALPVGSDSDTYRDPEMIITRLAPVEEQRITIDFVVHAHRSGATEPPAKNLLQQQEKFDRFIGNGLTKP